MKEYYSNEYNISPAKLYYASASGLSETNNKSSLANIQSQNCSSSLKGHPENVHFLTVTLNSNQVSTDEPIQYRLRNNPGWPLSFSPTIQCGYSLVGSYERIFNWEQAVPVFQQPSPRGISFRLAGWIFHHSFLLSLFYCGKPSAEKLILMVNEHRYADVES